MTSSGISPERGYANLLTGSLHLLDIPVPALFKYLLQRKLPSVFLPSFLHEATHFWCMASDLGGALALIEMRGHHTLALKQPDRQRPLHDYGVVQVMHQLLRPLLEGMALFQEFDAMPGASDVISTPGFWAGLLFQPLDQDPPQISDSKMRSEWLTNEIISTLVWYRASRQARQRKTGVLMRSLSNDSHHYLSGYLAVKNLWINSVYSTPAFLDRDLFLSFLRDWIFQDWLLIDYLLDDDFSCGVVSYMVSERMQRRLVELATEDLSEEVAAYDREVGSGSRDPATSLRSLRLEEGEARDGQMKMRVLLDEIRRGMDGGEDENRFLADLLTLEHRQKMMRLALEPVEIEVNEHNRVLVRKNASIESTYLAGPAPPEAERGVTSGWITAYFLPADRSMMVLAVRENQPMIWIPPSATPEDDLAILRLAVTKIVTTEEARRKFTALGRDVVARFQDEDYESTMEMLPTHVRQIYTQYALSTVPDKDRLSKIEVLLERKGLYDLLGKDGDVLTALVEISLMPSLLNESSKPQVRKSLKQMGIDLDQALEQLHERQEATGLPLLVALEDFTMCMV